MSQPSKRPSAQAIADAKAVLKAADDYDVGISGFQELVNRMRYEGKMRSDKDWTVVYFECDDIDRSTLATKYTNDQAFWGIRVVETYLCVRKDLETEVVAWVRNQCISKTADPSL